MVGSPLYCGYKCVLSRGYQLPVYSVITGPATVMKHRLVRMPSTRADGARVTILEECVSLALDPVLEFICVLRCFLLEL